MQHPSYKHISRVFPVKCSQAIRQSTPQLTMAKNSRGKVGDMDVKVAFHLGNGVHVQTMHDGDTSYVDIRKCFHTPDGGWKPTQHGIRLTSTSWLKLLEVNEHLVADIANVKKRRHVNKNYPLEDDAYASVISPWWEVDVYLGYVGEDGVLKRGWKGISLTLPQWIKLMDLSSSITPPQHVRQQASKM